MLSQDKMPVGTRALVKNRYGEDAFAVEVVEWSGHLVKLRWSSGTEMRVRAKDYDLVEVLLPPRPAASSYDRWVRLMKLIPGWEGMTADQIELAIDARLTNSGLLTQYERDMILIGLFSGRYLPPLNEAATEAAINIVKNRRVN